MSLIFKVGGKKDLPKKPTGWPKCGSYVNKDREEYLHSNVLSRK
jgi:hypothetical protein